jgi:hypothetical protein
MPSLFAAFFLVLSLAASGRCDNSAAPSPLPAALVNSYNGGYKDDYPQELVRVQSYILSVQSDIATQLGLQYGQGFLHPVSIRFADGAPTTNENPFFYVQAKGSGDQFTQDLIANVEAFAKRRSELLQEDSTLRNGFRYALTQVMLNDLSAGDAESAFPLWVQEGLSVYASGNGDAFVKTAAARTFKSNAGDLVCDLNSPGPYLTARTWAGYYLAIKYIFDTDGLSGLQAFVRNMADGKSAPDAVRDATSQDWSAFTASVHDYSLESFKKVALDDSQK